MNTVSVVKVAPDLYFVFGTYKRIQWKEEKKKPDADTMDVNTSLRVTHKVCVSNGQILL